MRAPAVKSRTERLRRDGQRLMEEVEELYEREILRLPLALREMSWLEFFAMGQDGAGTGLAGARFPFGYKT